MAWLGVLALATAVAGTPAQEASAGDRSQNPSTQDPSTQDPSTASPPRGDPFAAWQTEQVVLRDGRTLRGLISWEEAGSLELVEIRQPPGKRMFLIVRPIELTLVERIVRLAPADREELAGRIYRFRNRARIEATRLQSVSLTRVGDADESEWRYTGSWFDLESSADEATTRRLIVDLDQRFRAFRQLLPVRRQPTGRLRVVVRDRLADYFALVEERGLNLQNLACYDASQNLILAGSDLDRYRRELANVAQRHRRLREELARETRALEKDLARRREILEQQNGLPDDWSKIVKAAYRRLRDRRQTLQDQITAAERRNRAALDARLGRMLGRLHHEAFHAYLDNYVYDRDSYDIPRWLNEGLAQVCETGLVEDGVLRIDAPRADALARLQRELASDAALTVTELLEADPSRFLVFHSRAGTSSARHYSYSWGLAHHLAFSRSLVGTAALDEYFSLASKRLPPRARFERLVGVPLDVFEREWREEMLNLRPAGRP